MKKTSFIILATALFGLVACNGGTDTIKSDWSDAEKALLETYAYGEEIPFIYIEGNGEMYYDADYGCLSVTGGNATAQQLSDYATVLDSYGYSGYYYDDSLYYDYMASVNTEDGMRYIELQFYCLDSDSKTAASGVFWLDVYDPYYYNWSDMPIADYLLELSSPSSTAIPELSASYYIFDDSYFDSYETIGVYAYGVDASTCEATYKSILESASWTVNYVEDEDYGNYYDAVSPSQDLELQFAYNSSYESMDIYIFPYAS